MKELNGYQLIGEETAKNPRILGLLKKERWTDKEANEYFQWYVSIVPSRLKVLKSTIANEDKKLAEKLDYSPNSLNVVWGWFTKHITTMKKLKEDIKQEMKNRPPLLKNTPIQDWKFSYETTSLIIDVAMYLDEVILRNNKDTKRDCMRKGGKSYINYHKPVIIFDTGWDIESTRLIHVMVLKFNEKTLQESLKEMYELWVDGAKKYNPKKR